MEAGTEPMRALRGLSASDLQSRQLSLQWENLAFNLTRCHTYSVSLCYRYTTAGGGGGHNTTVRECLAVEHNASRFTLRDLPPYHGIHVRLSLANPEGKKEGREVTFQTEEDIPGGIAPESLTFTPLDDMIFLKWEEPVEPNGLITQYEISYQSIESSDPGINVPGPRRTVSKMKNETYHMFSNLHPGTTYLISVRARTAKGFGQTALTEITTNISAPTFDYGDMPSPLSETESTITVLLRPAQGRGAPVSTYQVVIEEETVKKVKREIGLQECFPLPMSHGEAQARGTPHYYTAELPPSSLPEASPFTVGDNHTYNGYWNSPLDPRKSYLVYFQAMSNFRGLYTDDMVGTLLLLFRMTNTQFQMDLLLMHGGNDLIHDRSLPPLRRSHRPPTWRPASMTHNEWTQCQITQPPLSLGNTVAFDQERHRRSQNLCISPAS
ncbi:unnamed protein product, partial [Pleuronectes platessa]